jgi:hypothetical protein
VPDSLDPQTEPSHACRRKIECSSMIWFSLASFCGAVGIEVFDTTDPRAKKSRKAPHRQANGSKVIKSSRWQTLMLGNHTLPTAAGHLDGCPMGIRSRENEFFCTRGRLQMDGVFFCNSFQTRRIRKASKEFQLWCLLVLWQGRKDCFRVGLTGFSRRNWE